MKNLFFIHLKCLALGTALSLTPDLDYLVNLRGTHLDIGFPLSPLRLSVISERQHSADMLFLRSRADQPPPEPIRTVFVNISCSRLLANIGIGYLFFLGLSTLTRIFTKSRPAKPPSKKPAHTDIIITSLVVMLSLIEVFSLHYLTFYALGHVPLCVALSLLAAISPLVFFFCTDTFLHYGFRIALCVWVHVYMLYFLVCYVFHAMSLEPSFLFDTIIPLLRRY